MRAGKRSIQDAVGAELANIEEYAEDRNAFVTVFSGEHGLALARSRQLDSHRTRAPLLGVPLTIKDNTFLGGFPTTDGSESFSDFVPSTNAAVVDQLLEAGCVPLGKTNLHEFALGVTGTSGLGGPIRNPVDPSRVSGGSSGGSAVSVRMAKGPILSLGSDTGGSIRIPASLCGVCGFKPSWGVLSRVGLFPLSASLDHAGFFTRSPADASLTHGVLTGVRARARSLWKVGVPDRYFVDDMDEQVSRAFWGTLDSLKESGRFRFRDVKVPGGYALYSRARAAIMCKEASWFYKPVLDSERARKGAHKDVLALLDWGRKVGDLQYMRSLNLRTESVAAMTGLLKGLDVLMMPTTLIVAPKVEEALGKETGALRSMLLRNTELFNMSGLPAFSMPMSPRYSGLPTGLQVVGGPGGDADVLGAAEAAWSAVYP